MADPKPPAAAELPAAEPPAATTPAPLDVPLQWEIGSAATPERNLVVIPRDPGDAPEILTGEQRRERIMRADAAAVPIEGRTCGGCRWFDHEAGLLAVGSSKGMARAFFARMFRGWRVGRIHGIGACRLAPASSALIVQGHERACEKWENAGKLVSFTGQRKRS